MRPSGSALLNWKEIVMATFFGVDEHNAQGFIDHKMVCLPRTAGGPVELHGVVSPIRNEDVVFIKRCTPESSMHIKAVGVVRSEFPIEDGADVCLPVEWVWQGEKELENVEEVLSFCDQAMYEEHNIMVQREIIELLPKSMQLSQEW
jgi:hypothetical protein